jgi:hypothetical protein
MLGDGGGSEHVGRLRAQPLHAAPRSDPTHLGLGWLTTLMRQSGAVSQTDERGPTSRTGWKVRASMRGEGARIRLERRTGNPQAGGVRMRG